MNYSSFAVLLFWTTIGCLTAYIAKQRNRNPLAWFFIGLFFSLFGLVLLLLLPSKTNLQEKQEDIKVPDIKATHSESAALSGDSMYSGPSMPRISRDTTLDWYFIDNASKIIGPLKLSALRKTLIESKMDQKTYIWCEEFLDWTLISDLQNGAFLLDPDFL
jgi:hypothetical protein